MKLQLSFIRKIFLNILLPPWTGVINHFYKPFLYLKIHHRSFVYDHFCKPSNYFFLFGNALNCFLSSLVEDPEIAFNDFDKPSCSFDFLFVFQFVCCFFVSAAEMFAKGLKIVLNCFYNRYSNVVRLIFLSNILKSFLYLKTLYVSNILLVKLTMLWQDSRSKLKVYCNLSVKAMICIGVIVDEMNEVLIYL